MAETGVYGRFLAGSLDPRAQEFRPRYSTTLFMPQPHRVFFQYPTISDVPLLPFCETGATYPPFPTAESAYVPVRSPVSSVATRSLVVSSVPCDVSETMVRRELEVFGEIRGVQMERVKEGIVIVHFYDIRHAERALREIRDQHMHHQCRLRNYFNNNNNNNNGFLLSNSSLPRPSPAPGLIAGHAVWAQFIVPAGKNQGTIVIFNLDSTVSTSCLKEIFERFGQVKELRETPLKKQQRFVEFFDIRDAGKALKEMNGKEINGKSVLIEFSRPGGHGNKFFNANLTTPAICGSNNIYSRSLKCPPSRPPPPPPRSFSGGVGSNVPPRWYYSKPHTSSRKWNLNKGSRSPRNPRKSSESDDVYEKMGSVDLNAGGECNEIEERESFGVLRKNSKNSHSSSSVGADQQQVQPSRNKLRKCRQSRKFDSRFLINDNDSDCRDSRTTVMIKNIPNKYSQKLLLNMLDNHCIHCNEQVGDDHNEPLSSYDFVYLPIDFNNKCNVGYGFVNMTSPEATWRLYKAFHLQPWEVFNSRKICEVTYARVQGLESLKEHFKNSKFPCEMDHYLPVVFSPPRDGRKLTEPMPIGGQRQSIAIGLSTTPSCSGNDEMEGEEEDDDVATTTTLVDDQQEESMKGNNNSSSGSIDEDDTDGDEYHEVS
ncbi:protein terminal ear1-like protein [Cucumis melo var. makuwa]|uniref:Protein terminal ear1 homolog n=2 Tax=Cucumis melo TaxID=3656 RepID=A0A1S3BEB3_CUCME|nr:protein terminal ear1 homolog [Cucumis melo]KAA0034242.1 protein terminal ear1-like protein [Cucumis melo var. makuwa]